jgi:hypothetical protein
VRASAEIFHEVFEGLVVAFTAGWVTVVGAIEGCVEVESWFGGVGWVEVWFGDAERCVGDADFDRGVDVDSTGREGDAGCGLVAVEPGLEAIDGFRAFGEGEGPL